MQARGVRAPVRWYIETVDPLKADDIAQARRTPPAEKLRQALDLMAMGIELKRDNLRRRHPAESDDEIQARLQRWLDRVDD
jgi:hypothetical protein